SRTARSGGERHVRYVSPHAVGRPGAVAAPAPRAGAACRYRPSCRFRPPNQGCRQGNCAAIRNSRGKLYLRHHIGHRKLSKVAEMDWPENPKTAYLREFPREFEAAGGSASGIRDRLSCNPVGIETWVARRRAIRACCC